MSGDFGNEGNGSCDGDGKCGYGIRNGISSADRATMPIR